MNEEKFIKSSTILNNVCKLATLEYANEHKNSDVIFEVYQLSKLSEILTPFNILEFYNENWTGNIDFMHIPDYAKVIDNVKNYPIIIAYDKTNRNLLGISTLQYKEASGDFIDPYFPEKGASYFSMTGILTNKRNKLYGYKGIGNKIYEIELMGALKFKQEFKDTRIMCVIDCRNKHSIFALEKAARNLSQKFDLAEKNLEFPAGIVAYYTITNSLNQLLEAPTLVMEVGLKPVPIIAKKEKTIEYINTKNINESLLATIKQEFKPDLKYKPVYNIDYELDGAIVKYTRLDAFQNQLKDFSVINTNNTELGNDRIPLNPMDLINQMSEYNKDKVLIKKLG